MRPTCVGLVGMCYVQNLHDVNAYWGEALLTVRTMERTWAGGKDTGKDEPGECGHTYSAQCCIPCCLCLWLYVKLQQNVALEAVSAQQAMGHVALVSFGSRFLVRMSRISSG